VTGRIVEKKKPLSPPLGEAFENVDGLINLLEEVVGIEVPIVISACLENDPGFPGECETDEING
jgi:hypothetical protein